jgi:GH15 family glucan-1,4-alpha-glucosidase
MDKESGVHRYRMGIVGNCSCIAYIDDEAAVRWLCLPRFDSSFVFGSLLDEDKGGEFSVRPLKKLSSSQYYIENTNILCTEIESDEGRFRVTDFAPRFPQYDRYFRPLMLVRKIEPVEGQPRIVVRCLPVGEYGRLRPEITFGSNHIRYLNLGVDVRLATDVSISNILDGRPFVLNGTRYLLFSYGPPLEAPLESTVEDFLKKTRAYWQQWAKATSIAPIFQDAVIRSALVLKLHQFEDTGGIIAAGTTSLPESPQSGRTWDYRYCWLRDTYFTLTAFNNIGHFEELERYFRYVENLIANDVPGISPVYTVGGANVPDEQTLNLAGYLGNTPVRLGNGAGRQKQYDVYGEILVSLMPLYVDKRLCNVMGRSSPDLVHKLLNRIEAVFDEPDAGIWEFRNRQQLNCYTYLFHWAGSSAAKKIATMLQDKEMENKAASLIKRSAERIEQCYDAERQVYTEAVNVRDLDASTLQLISFNYLDPGSERARRHLAAVEKELKTERGLFYRYIHEDDFGKPQSAFLFTAFWYVEALACVGRVREAMDSLKQLLVYANHVGLFSEDAKEDGSQWGNFPQAYSHVGFMNAVYRLARKLDQPMFF